MAGLRAPSGGCWCGELGLTLTGFLPLNRDPPACLGPPASMAGIRGVGRMNCRVNTVRHQQKSHRSQLHMQLSPPASSALVLAVAVL